MSNLHDKEYASDPFISDLKYKLGHHLYNKLAQLQIITSGLKEIHQQGLIHRDFLRPGNILGEETENIIGNITSFYIADLRLSRPVYKIKR